VEKKPATSKTWFSLLIIVFDEFIERLPLLRHRAGAVKSKVGPACGGKRTGIICEEYKPGNDTMD
jgi:hypothetical protein